MKQLRIALTGGPSAGKTTLLQALQKEFHKKIATVPETASILYRGGFHRSENPNLKVHIQRAIYFVQLESEAIVTKEYPHRHIICDRGTLDGLAYWPSTESDFFSNLGTTLENEINRYDWVIHLDSACQEGYDSSNPIRMETPEEALLVNNKVKDAWSTHPQRLIIGATQDFIRKMRLSQAIVRKIMSGASYPQIATHFERFFENS